MNTTDRLLVIWSLVVLVIFLPLAILLQGEALLELVLSAGIVWGVGTIIIINWRKGE